MQAKIGFYSDALTSGNYGLGRYASELIRALHRLPNAPQIRPISAHCRLEASRVQALKKNYSYQQLPWGRKATAALWSTVGLPLLEHWAPWADIVHCVELDYKVATRKPFVVTIHDIGPLTHPEYFSTSHPWLLEKALRYAVARADAIICVSQATADAVQNYIGRALGDRLHVIWEGVGEEFFRPVEAGQLGRAAAFASAPEPYFLWTGSLNPRKNMARVVRAFEQVATTLPHHLVLVGGLGWDAHGTLQTVENSPFRSRIHLPGRVSDEELRGFYQHAAGFIYPSLMEGFGLPILEAMASGCPVITSDRSSMSEVAGPAAVLANPENVEALAEALRQVASEDALANRLRTEGRNRAATFQWDTCAASVMEVYQAIAQRRFSLHSPKVNPSVVPA